MDGWKERHNLEAINSASSPNSLMLNSIWNAIQDLEASGSLPELFLFWACSARSLPFVPLPLGPVPGAIRWVMGPGLLYALVCSREGAPGEAVLKITPLDPSTSGHMLPSACNTATKTQHFVSLSESAGSTLPWRCTQQAREASHQVASIILNPGRARGRSEEITSGNTKASTSVHDLWTSGNSHKATSAERAAISPPLSFFLFQDKGAASSPGEQGVC